MKIQESAENYLEMILILKNRLGNVRVQSSCISAPTQSFTSSLTPQGIM